MPLYSYTCPDCDESKDEYRSVENRNDSPDCSLCKKPMVKTISGYSVIGDLDYYDENLQTHVKSRKHREKVMRDQGVQEKFGLNWHTAASSKQRKAKCRI